MNVHIELAKRCEHYPLYSQENLVNPLVCAKLFFSTSCATWYITEYNPITWMAFGFIVGLGESQWGYVPINELAAIKIAGMFSIEIDPYFEPVPVSELGIWR